MTPPMIFFDNDANEEDNRERTIGNILALLVVIFVLGLVVFTIIAYLNEEFVSGGIGAATTEAAITIIINK